MRGKQGIRKARSSKSPLKSRKLGKVNTLASVGIRLNHNETLLLGV